MSNATMSKRFILKEYRHGVLLDFVRALTGVEAKGRRACAFEISTSVSRESLRMLIIWGFVFDFGICIY